MFRQIFFGTVLNLLALTLFQMSDVKALETKNNDEFSLERLNSYAEKAYSESENGFMASSPRTTGSFARFSIIRNSGLPIMSIVSEKIRGKWGIGLSLSCERERTIDIVALLRFSRLSSGINKVNLTENLQLIISSSQWKLKIPVKVIDDVQKESAIQVHGSANIDEPFFNNMGTGRYLTIKLVQNGKFTNYSRGEVLLDQFDTGTGLLLEKCRGEPENDQIAQVTEKNNEQEATSYWTPNAREIKDALQRRVTRHIKALEKTGNDCESLGRSSNSNNISPFKALGCLVGEVTKRTNLKVHIDRVNLKKCVRSETDIAYCLYDVKADTQLPSSAKLLETIFDSAFLLPHPVWGSYVRVNGRWEHRQTFKNCSLSERQIDCSFQ